jgi:hypothetical protein
MELLEMPFPPMLAAYMEKSPKAVGIANASAAVEDKVLYFMVSRKFVRSLVQEQDCGEW